MYKSEQLALNIRQLIENGAWKAHSKLPSLREQSQISGYSLMTVLNAYQELEAQGLVYAKQKSGFYVAERLNQTEQPVPSSLSLNAHIQMNSLVFGYLKSIQPTDVSPLGSAFPNAELLFNPQIHANFSAACQAKSQLYEP